MNPYFYCFSILISNLLTFFSHSMFNYMLISLVNANMFYIFLK